MNYSRFTFPIIFLAFIGTGCQNRVLEVPQQSEEVAQPIVENASPELEPVVAAPSLKEIQDIQSWMTNFHKEPDPDRLVLAIRKMGTDGLWEKSGHIGTYFLAEVFRLYPDRVSAWAGDIHDLPEDHRHWVCIAVWLSQVEGWEDVLTSFIPEAGEDFEKSLRNYLDGKPAGPLETPLSASALDMLWVSYFASGKTEYIDKIVSALSISHSEEDGLENLTVYGAARWSLASNATQHNDIRVHLMGLVEKSSGVEKQELTEILDGLPGIQVDD